ncbi:hypothetical protein LCGC14_0372280 [marine sediment metagenome]|uniref:Uncharacterized protein n=1 Tax=marine sediment metagenome TaxID=412755 RepID=A0A0F9TMN8_9ZZZZ
MFGRVTIYVDSEVVTSFKGDLDQWMYRHEFKVARHAALPQYGVGDIPEPQLTTHRTLTLKLQAQLLGSNPEPYICLFFYNYDNPTEKQMGLDVAMAQGQMRNIL